jgi:HEAT repeat protein
MEPLLLTLKDEDPEVRAQAAWGLGRTGDARVVEPLMGSMMDINSEVQMRSAESLRFMGMEHTIPETMRSSICPGCV